MAIAQLPITIDRETILAPRGTQRVYAVVGQRLRTVEDRGVSRWIEEDRGIVSNMAQRGDNCCLRRVVATLLLINKTNERIKIMLLAEKQRQQQQSHRQSHPEPEPERSPLWRAKSGARASQNGLAA